MTNPFLDLPGAVVAESLGVAAHYGAPLPEQRALEDGDAIVDLSHRGVVTVSGADRLSWLHSMTSQQLTGLRPGESTETLLLDSNGRIECAMRVVDDGERCWLLTDEGAAAPLVEFLLRMRFALRVEVHDASGDYAAVAAFDGGAALPALRDSGIVRAEWRDPWAGVLSGGVQYAAAEHPAAKWSASQVIMAREDLPAVAALVADGVVQTAGILALDALEVRAWRPSQHGEVDARALPHEFDWMRTAVHLTKGCYRGQETVAKVHNLGHPPRRLALLHLDGSRGELPGGGALVFRVGDGSGARPVGRLTRVALHHEWGGIALALLKRSVPEDAELEVRFSGAADEDASAGAQPDGGASEVVAASQETIVPQSAGAAREVPRLKRL